MKDDLTTILSWKRYNGKKDTLPKEGRYVMVCRCKGFRQLGIPRKCKLRVYPWGMSWSGGAASPVRNGDTWTYWPTAPEV